jgi:hypothetical protein
MYIPAHKVVGDEHKPGQTVNSFDRYPYLKHSTADTSDQTLGDYLARKKRYAALDTVALEKINVVKKLTFEQWFDTQVKLTGFSDPWQNSYDSAKDAWKAAQENI